MPSPDSHGARFAQAHGPSACAMAFRVKDAGAAFKRAAGAGRHGRSPQKTGPMELNIPAIEGIGGSVIYLVDRYGAPARSMTSISCPSRRASIRLPSLTAPASS